jgi:hypothetical protein
MSLPRMVCPSLITLKAWPRSVTSFDRPNVECLPAWQQYPLFVNGRFKLAFFVRCLCSEATRAEAEATPPSAHACRCRPA